MLAVAREGKQAGANMWKTGGNGPASLCMLSAADGSVLWEVKPAGNIWPIVNGLFWNSNKQYDPKTGEIKGTLPVVLDCPHGFPTGCAPGLIIGGHIMANPRWGWYMDWSKSEGATQPASAPTAVVARYGGMRGQCIHGAPAANGMFYAGQNSCVCDPGQLEGFVAFGPCGPLPAAADFERARPVEKGPAFGSMTGADRNAAATDWPTFFHDTQRSGVATGKIPEKLRVLWQTEVVEPAEHALAEVWRGRLRSSLTAPVVSGGTTFVATVEGGQVVAVDAAGRPQWRFTAGGRIDTPPTIHGGLCLFGSHDGWVYALRATDGLLAWRTRIAPWERRMVAFGQVESVWPAIGSVLVHEGVVFAVAGRTTESDGGLVVMALDLVTGAQVWAKGFDSGPARDPSQRAGRGFGLRSRDVDVLVLREGRIGLPHLDLDPKTGATAPMARNVRVAGLQGLVEGAWTRLGPTRRFGLHKFGMVTGDLLLFSDTTIFGYQAGYYGFVSGARTCFAVARDVALGKAPSAAERAATAPNRPARPPDRLLATDFAWRVPVGANRQVEAMAVCDNVMLLAGRHVEPRTQKVSGFLTLLSADKGEKVFDLPLDAPPAYQGLAIAGGRVYATLHNGSVACLSGAE